MTANRERLRRLDDDFVTGQWRDSSALQALRPILRFVTICAVGSLLGIIGMVALSMRGRPGDDYTLAIAFTGPVFGGVIGAVAGALLLMWRRFQR